VSCVRTFLCSDVMTKYWFCDVMLILIYMMIMIVVVNMLFVMSVFVLSPVELLILVSN
jgi:hypothetical protein